MGIKNLLKKFYPIPTHSFYAETERLHSQIAQLAQVVKELEDRNRSEILVLWKLLSAVEKSAGEAVWANVFHDATVGSDWLTDKAFWQGRASLGYQAMYVVYRILNEIRPKRILELGLGQSTKLISQYVWANADVLHTVVENNEAWIRFFTNVYTPPFFF